MSQRIGLLLAALFPLALGVVVPPRPMRAAALADAVAIATCDKAAVARARAEFERLSALHRFHPRAVSMDALRAASFEYVARAEACYHELFGPPTGSIDNGGLILGGDGFEQFNLWGTKWGGGTPFPSNGTDANGPRIAGGLVTYSFMASGIGGFEIEGTPGLSVAVDPSGCWRGEITSAFAAWSAIANIQFTEVADGGQPFNAPGATGDIRIASHVFDGPSGVLAHAYLPPPNGFTAAGDMHFDIAESWSCTPGPGLIDFGIVAAHEIGHAIGLHHENRYISPGRTALMNPFYNPSVVSMPIGDDINGAENIYGSAVGHSPDAIVDFGASHGAWILDFGVNWTQLHPISPEEVITGDLDGNGIDDIIADFGASYGLWARMNNTTWVQLHPLSPTRMAVGNLDNTGRDDLVAGFADFGLFLWMNNAAWSRLSPLNPLVLAIGNVDGYWGDDLVATFSGYGVLAWMNNYRWAQVHLLEADEIVIGDLDETLARGNDADDIVLSVAGSGIFFYPNFEGFSRDQPVHLHPLGAVHLAAGDLNRDGRDELLLDFGPTYGIWVFKYSVGWTQLHPLASEGLALGDLDGNGQAEVLVDFGSTHGLWMYVNNASWIQAHPVSPEGFAIGDLN